MSARTDTEITNPKVTDPVCGMTFRVSKAAEVVRYEGRDAYFCTHACRLRFEATPDQFRGDPENRR